MCVGPSTAVKVDLGRPNSRSVHPNARKGAETLLWELAFVCIVNTSDEDGYEVVKRDKCSAVTQWEAS